MYEFGKINKNVRIVITAFAIVLVITLVVLTYFCFRVYKGKVEALNIAIAACGAKASDVHDVEIDYDTSIRGVVYDVEFYYNKQKYEYKIGPDKSIIYSTNGIDD